MANDRAKAASPELVEAAPHPDAGWDAFVEDAPGGSYCHLSGWGAVLGDVLGHEPLFLHARGADGGLEGVLPLVRVRSRIFGHFLVSMPFLNYGGPVGSPPARAALADWALAAAKGSGADLLELRSRPGGEVPEAAEGEEGLQVTGRKVTVILPLPSDPEVLWEEGLRSKIRSQVRRPMKEGLEARFGSDQVDAFYGVFARNMRDLGTPVLPIALFHALPEVFGDRVSFCVVYREGVPVAAGCGFLAAGEFEITWASALREHSKAAPNMLLYWRMMEHAIERGAGAFNFGRCTPDTGSHRFKQQWGGEDVPLPWAAWSPDGDLATPNPEQGKYAHAISVWQRLPVGLTRLIGPPIARRIP